MTALNTDTRSPATDFSADRSPDPDPGPPQASDALLPASDPATLDQPSAAGSDIGIGVGTALNTTTSVDNGDGVGVDDGFGTAGDSGRGLSGAVDVLCDSTGPLGALSYLVPDRLTVARGDAVEVPFGKSTRRGVVVGPASSSKATRHITSCFGPRVAPAELDLAERIAEEQFSSFAKIAPRLAPASRRGNPPTPPEPLQLVEGLSASSLQYPNADDIVRNRLLLRAPLVSSADLAAVEAHRLACGSVDGQVLVLCPSKKSVTAVTRRFVSGAARLDRVPGPADPSPWKGFVSGVLRVAVGTRSAALWSAKNLAGIVVVDEDHPGHQERQLPHTHARDVAVARSRLLGCCLTLISAHPSTKALGAGVKVRAVGSSADWPAVVLVDRDRFDPRQALFAPPLRAAVSASATVPVVVAPARSQHRRCVSCGTDRACGVCDEPFCRCPPDGVCSVCSDPKVVWRGLGPQRVQALFKERLGVDVRVVGFSELSRIRNAGLVIVLDVDAALKSSSFIPGSFAAALLMEAARAAGRDGTLVVGTQTASHPVLVHLLKMRDQGRQARADWAEAKTQGLPPFGKLVEIHLSRKKMPTLGLPAGRVLGPVLCGVNEWEAMVLVSAEDLPKLRSPVERLRRAGRVRVSVT